MVKYAEAENIYLKYLTELATDYKSALGLILGQISCGKYSVIHLTKTPTFHNEEHKNTPVKPLKNVSEVNENWIADHALQTMKMLPGGLCILGIFIVSDEELLNPLNAKIKSVLLSIEKQLSAKKYLCSVTDNEKLILHYAPKNQKYSAKSYNISKFDVHPVDFKFMQKPTKWINFEWRYKIDKIHYLKVDEPTYPLGKHIKVILDEINSSLRMSIVLFDNDRKDDFEKVENIGKKKKDVDETKIIHVSILEQCVTNDSDGKIETINTGGHIRIVGEVVSQLCLNSNVSAGDASNAVFEDIMRSLATRLEMHYDSLTEEELSEDVNSVHEPPRRILIHLPDNNMIVSDYLFPGEGPEDVKAALEELLDIKPDNNKEIIDIEGQADISQYYTEVSTTKTEDFLPIISTDSNRFTYLLGITVAVAVLFISIFIHVYCL